MTNTTIICSTLKINIIDFSNITNNKNISSHSCNPIINHQITDREFQIVFIISQCIIFIITMAILNTIFVILYAIGYVAISLIKLMWYIIYNPIHYVYSCFTTDNKENNEEKIKVA